MKRWKKLHRATESKFSISTKQKRKHERQPSEQTTKRMAVSAHEQITTRNKSCCSGTTKRKPSVLHMQGPPPKMLRWNARGLVNRDTKCKIGAIGEHAQVNNVFLMNFTET